MSLQRLFFLLLLNLILVLTVACTPQAVLPVLESASTSAAFTETSTCLSTGSSQPCSTSALVVSSPTVLIEHTQVPDTIVPTASPTLQAPVSPTLLPITLQATPTLCPPDLCTYASQYFLARPIASSGNDGVDATYRFGSTQGKRRDPHHGVEFLNGFGTPVLAAADGIVVVAGEDREPTSARGVWPITFYGAFSYFYGNLVVIEHQVPAVLRQIYPDMPLPLYTLYGHLSEISVEVGQHVLVGQEIGKVGMAGVAEGSHLHFEVRLGENTYLGVRNPELWLIPHADSSGQLMGGIAGRIIDSYGNNLEMSGIVLEHLPEGPEGPRDVQFTLMTYEEKKLVGQPPWMESFAIGDIPAGWYRISFPRFGVQKFLVQVYPGQLTVVTMRVE